MENEKYIDYLNSLHNYNAQNGNAYGEENIESDYYKQIMVKMGLCDFIVEDLSSNEPHIIILTGHAGDGKTSLMYQVMGELNIEFNNKEKANDVILPNGKKCRCIKDFSELSELERSTAMRDLVEFPKEGNYVFLVANTGPLINTFGNLFEDEDDKERAQIALIESMDSNTGKVENIYGYNICTINVAAVDNTGFPEKLLTNIIKDELWNSCSECNKNENCHIYNNRNLIYKNKKQVFDFINKHYIWLIEYGKRLTVRSMTEQLVYMITGGISCKRVKNNEVMKFQYFFPNLFFGYIGTRINYKAHNIGAIYEAYNLFYDKRRLRSDENIFIESNEKTIFGQDVVSVMNIVKDKLFYVSGWMEATRRIYFFLNIITDDNIKERDCEDMFSKCFARYLKFRDGTITPSRADTTLVLDALSMIYVGTTCKEGEIPLTLRRETGITQNVQMIAGTLPVRKMSIESVVTEDGTFNRGEYRYKLYLKIDKDRIECPLSLPLLNYFEELKNGIISTNIDPQLSHGVESLKAQISELMDDDESLEIIVLKNNGNDSIRLEITEDNKIRRL